MSALKRVNELFQKVLGRSDVWFGGSLYMRRWRLLHTRWFGVRIHHIVRSDNDRELHDHPFTFVSLVLRGGYYEHTVDGRRVWYGPGSLIVRSADALHRLEMEKVPAAYGDGYGVQHPLELPAWTLVVRGPMRREWGFLLDGGVWKPADDEELKKARRRGDRVVPPVEKDRPFLSRNSI